MKKAISIFLCYTSAIFAQTDVQRYANNNDYQVHCAKKTLEIFHFNGNERVLDIGCGDGKITQFLQDELTTGEIVGIDLSKEMIEHAVKSYPTISFTVKDAKELDYIEEFDLAVSFSTLEWIDDQPGVIQKVFHSLKPGGRVILDLPTKLFNPTLFKAIKNVIKSEKWRDFFEYYQPNWVLHDIRDYHEMFYKSGFHLEAFRPRMDEYYFASKDEIKNYLRPWFPYLSELKTEEQKQEFIHDVVEEYCRLLQLNEKTIVPFTSQRITIIGKKH